MTALVLLRLEGPLQSWGTSSRFEERATGREPSKSGVLGLICAAMGVGRDDPAVAEGGSLLAALTPLRMAVRVDREGVPWRDLHMARFDRPPRQPRGAKPMLPGQALRSVRHYLSDASFVVALSGDGGMVAAIDAALRAPRWPPYLGRRGCPPSRPLHWGEPLAFPPGTPPGDALFSLPWEVRSVVAIPAMLRVVEDADATSGAGEGDLDLVVDVPVSLARRRFAARLTRTRLLSTTALAWRRVTAQ